MHSPDVLPTDTAPAATATLIAAAIAAVAGIVATVVGAVNAAKARRRTDRDQWWKRFIWAVDRATSERVGESELGLALLLILIRTSRASEEDTEAAVAMADLIEARGLTSTKQAGRKGRRG